MGLFSTETIVTVATSATRVIEDDKLPNSVRAGSIQGLMLDEGEQLVEHIMEQLTSSMGITANRAYQYGKTRYVNGLPSSAYVHTGQGIVVASNIWGVPQNQIEYFHFGALNNQHVGWQVLFDSYGYDQSLNELTVLSALKGFPVYLDDFEVVVKEATPQELRDGSLEQWGASAKAGPTPLRKAVIPPSMFPGIPIPTVKATPIKIDSTAVEDYFILSIIWQEVIVETINGQQVTHKTIKREKINIPYPVMDKGKGYFQAKYFLADPDIPGPYDTVIPGKKHIKYFTYQEDTGTYPELDGLYSPEYTDLGSFYPWAYFRLEKTNVAEDTTSDQYKGSKKLVEMLPLPYDQIATAIDENPDIGEVESAVLMMAVPADTTDKLEQRYLFEFFNRMYFNVGGLGLNVELRDTHPVFNMADPTAFLPKKKMSMIIQDKTFKMSVAASAMRKFTRTGVKTTVGGYLSGKSSVTSSRQVSTEEGTNIIPISAPYFYYIKQVSANVYEEVQVFDLQTSYWVWRSYAATQDNGSTANLLIPLDKSIIDAFSTVDREKLCGRALHYIINSIHITKLAWYQQDWFSTFVMMVAFFWTAVTLGADGGTFAQAAAAMAQMTAQQLMVYIIVNVAIMVATSIALKMFVKAVGLQNSLIIAAMMIVMATYNAIEFGGIEGAPWAKDLLQTASGLFKAVSEGFTEALKGIQEDASAFLKEMKEQYKLLDETKELLEQNNWLSPFLVFGEKPQEYFHRTVHAGNIGIVGIDAIHTYVDSALTLPTLAQTLYPMKV